jgi:DNA-binding transcriptional MerR regulator
MAPDHEDADMASLTVASMAQSLGMPVNLVHYCRNRFAAYIPTAGDGRGRRYSAESLEVLRFVRDLVCSGVASEEIERALGELMAEQHGPGASARPPLDTARHRARRRATT